MVSIVALWLPIVLSALVVVLLSAAVHMVLRYHDADYGQLADEAAVMSALRGFTIPPGDYVMPRPATRGELQSAEYRERARQGPVAYLTVLPNGSVGFGRELLYWWCYCLVVSLFAAYLAGRALGEGSSVVNVFRFTSTTAFLGYALALWQQTIWYHRSVATTLRGTFDGLIYALATGAVFAWLWPV